jgi:hypothetical protein
VAADKPAVQSEKPAAGFSFGGTSIFGAEKKSD